MVLITSLCTVLSEAPFLTKLRPPWVHRPRGSVSSLQLQPGGGRRLVLRSVGWVAAHGSLVLCGWFKPSGTFLPKARLASLGV